MPDNNILKKKSWDVAVIGGGPAGLAAATAAKNNGASVCIIEREERAGGILKQCIHDGFGLIRFEEKLTGPEYACRYLETVNEKNIKLLLNTFLLEITKKKDSFLLSLINSSDAAFELSAKSVILATGCRERTARQIFIHGTRPAGIFTAGQAQYFINIQGYMPVKKCVILGSGDIGLIMARRLTLEGAEVEGVYEIQKEPSGLTRNIAQCLEDYNIPLHLGETVLKVHGKNRVEGVTVCKVDDNFKPLKETARFIECDSLVLSVGLIPENEIADPLDINIDLKTKGPVVDQTLMTSTDGVFSCGNALHVNDLVDYVSENGEIAGREAAFYALGRQIQGNNQKKAKKIPVKTKGNVLYCVPQFLKLDEQGKSPIYFRCSRTMKNQEVKIYSGEEEYFSKKYKIVKPPEMERILLDISRINSSANEITLEIMNFEPSAESERRK